MNKIPLYDAEQHRDVLGVHELKSSSDYDDTELHRHSYFEFFFIKKGKRSFSS